MAFFGLKLGLDLEMQAAHPHQKFHGVPPPPPGLDCGVVDPKKKKSESKYTIE